MVGKSLAIQDKTQKEHQQIGDVMKEEENTLGFQTKCWRAGLLFTWISSSLISYSQLKNTLVGIYVGHVPVVVFQRSALDRVNSVAMDWASAVRRAHRNKCTTKYDSLAIG